MRRAILVLIGVELVVSLLLIRGLRMENEAEEIRGWPRPSAGVVFGPPGAPTGGEIVVGVLVSPPRSRRLTDLAAPGTWEAFQEQEAHSANVEPAYPKRSLLPEDFDDSPRRDEIRRRTAAIRLAMKAVAEVVAAQTHVRVVFRDVLAEDATGIALVLVQRPLLHPGDFERLARLRAGGTCVIRQKDVPSDVGDPISASLADGPEAIQPLAQKIVGAVHDSPLLVRLPKNPLELVEAVREGDDVIVRLGARPSSASLRDLEDREVGPVSVAADGMLRVRCPDPALDPRAHRLIVRMLVGSTELVRAWTVAELVGAFNRRVVASGDVEAGAPYAPRVAFSRPGDGGAAPGVSERLALVVDDKIVAEAHGVTDALGHLDARLRVPEDVASEGAVLLVGEDRFPMRVSRGLRVSVVTDRALYRPTDDVHARVLVHRAASGRPVGNVEVTLRLGEVERHVTTSAHGVASAVFHLSDHEAGDASVLALVGGAASQAPIQVRTFETPTFSVVCIPSHAKLRSGEACPVRLLVRYTNGSPVVGAKYVDWANDGGPWPKPSDGVTDENGEATVVVLGDEDGDSRHVHFRVMDADGRSALAAFEVEGDERLDRFTLEALDEPILGRTGHVEIRGDGPGTVWLTLPQGSPQRVDLDTEGRGAVAWTPTSVHEAEFKIQGVDGIAVRRWVPVGGLDPRSRVIVLPARRVADLGETLEVDLLGPDGVVFVELARNDTVLWMQRARIENGSGHVAIPLSDGLAGLLTLRAGREDAKKVAGSQAVILVCRGRSLRVTARPSAPVWKPGDTATVDLEVSDRDGKPTAAVLGYWGVDAALLALEPWVDGVEDVFDVLRARGSRDETPVATAKERGRTLRFRAVQKALGPVSELNDLTRDLDISHESAPAREEAVRTKTKALFLAGMKRTRAGVLEALRGIPAEELKVRGSLLAMLRALVQERRLDPAMLRDVWGTPLAVGRGLEVDGGRDPITDSVWFGMQAGVPVRSAGPDVAFGTADDVLFLWSPISPTEVGQEIGRWLAFGLPTSSEPILEMDGDAHLLLAQEEFEGPAYITLIGIGGGAGGAFAGRGGHRNLRAGGGGGRRDYDSIPVRRDFAPTLCFVPEVIVGEDGKTRLEIPLKDSVTTWRLRLVASAPDGATGIGETTLRSSMPLHVEPWIATHLTVGDAVEIPVAVRNETEDAVTSRVEITVSAELELLGAREVSVSLVPRGTGSAVFRVRAARPGSARVKVDVESASARDSVERIIEIHHDARAVVATMHGTLRDGPPVLMALPAAAASGPEARRVTLYPSALAEVMGGFEGLIAAPHGCFEQTSSVVYPMVLAVSYMRRTGQDVPDLAKRAEQHIATGYDQLIGFEVDSKSGGFELWGRGPANLFLTAYALMEFRDLADVYPVDPALLRRITAWLVAHQAKDGSWSPKDVSPGELTDMAKGRAFDLTAYVAWGMARAKAPSEAGRTYLESNVSQVRNPYGMALGALALLTADPQSVAGHQLVDRLVATVEKDEIGALWHATDATGIGARGDSATIETTALAIQALMLDGRHSGLVSQALDRLVAWRDPQGRFGTTQSTILALKALLSVESGVVPSGDADVVARDGETDYRTVLPAGSTEPVHLDLGGRSAKPLALSFHGKGRVRAVLSRTTWTPWPKESASKGRLALEVRWPSETLAVGLPGVAQVEVRNRHSEREAKVVTLEIGIPPGCDIEPTDVKGEGAERVERSERAIVIYLRDLPARATRSFAISFRPRYVLDVATAPSKAYEYYVPEEAVEVAPGRVRAHR